MYILHSTYIFHSNSSGYITPPGTSNRPGGSFLLLFPRPYCTIYDGPNLQLGEGSRQIQLDSRQGLIINSVWILRAGRGSDSKY